MWAAPGQKAGSEVVFDLAGGVLAEVFAVLFLHSRDVLFGQPASGEAQTSESRQYRCRRSLAPGRTRAARRRMAG